MKGRLFRPLLGLAPALVVAWAGVASAQQATAVQLPTLSYFSAGTTVSVPDRGSVFLGGVSRAASGRNEFGVPLSPFRNQSFGMERSASGLWVSAYIHDFQAMDEYLLGQPSPRSQASSALRTLPGPVESTSRGPALVVQTSAMPAPVPPRAAKSGPLSMSVAELRARNAQAALARSRQAEDYFQRGQKAEVEGKASVARTYYQMAARRATGDLKDRITARLTLISSAALAGSGP